MIRRSNMKWKLLLAFHWATPERPYWPIITLSGIVALQLQLRKKYFFFFKKIKKTYPGRTSTLHHTLAEPKTSSKTLYIPVTTFINCCFELPRTMAVIVSLLIIIFCCILFKVAFEMLFLIVFEYQWSCTELNTYRNVNIAGNNKNLNKHKPQSAQVIAHAFSDIIPLALTLT